MVCKFLPRLCKLPVAISLGDAWGISKIGLPGQSVLAFISKSEDCAKRVRVWAGLLVSDSDMRLERSPQ